MVKRNPANSPIEVGRWPPLFTTGLDAPSKRWLGMGWPIIPAWWVFSVRLSCFQRKHSRSTVFSVSSFFGCTKKWNSRSSFFRGKRYMHHQIPWNSMGKTYGKNHGFIGIMEVYMNLSSLSMLNFWTLLMCSCSMPHLNVLLRPMHTTGSTLSTAKVRARRLRWYHEQLWQCFLASGSTLNLRPSKCQGAGYLKHPDAAYTFAFSRSSLLFWH